MPSSVPKYVKQSKEEQPWEFEGVPVEERPLADRRGVDSECHDKIFALLFLCQICVFTAGGVYCVNEITKDGGHSSHEHSKRFLKTYGMAGISFILAALVASFVFNTMWLKLMKGRTKCLVYSSLCIQVAFCVMMIMANPWFAIILVFQLFWYFTIIKYIDFAAFLVDVALKVVEHHPEIVSFALCCTFFGGVLLTGWVALATSIILYTQDADGVNPGIALACSASILWTFSTMANLLHVTISGVAGRWFFKTDENHGALGASVKQSYHSLGSVAFGSLIVTILEVIRSLVNSLRREDRRERNGAEAFMLCLLECIIGCIENLVEYVNFYAYSYIGVYGKSYIQSAKEVWSLFGRTGFLVVINDDLVSRVLMIGPFVAGCVLGLTSGAIAKFMLQMSGDTAIAMGVVVGFIGFGVTNVVMQLLHSIIVTLYICYLDDTPTFKAAHPMLYTTVTGEIGEKYPSFTPPQIAQSPARHNGNPEGFQTGSGIGSA